MKLDWKGFLAAAYLFVLAFYFMGIYPGVVGFLIGLVVAAVTLSIIMWVAGKLLHKKITLE